MSIATSAKTGAAPTILLVDDNRMGLSARKIVLEELGYHIVPCSNPIQALEQFSARSFDLVITDFRMPNMDGTELISLIRQSRPQIPVILISGFADTLGLDEQTTGADIVIQKSNHEVSNLIRSVQRLLSRRKPAASQSGRKQKRTAAV